MCFAGTATHRSRSYWDDNQLAVFDILIVVTDDRLTALDVELLHIATKVYGKPVAILKNKGDMHLEQIKRTDGLRGEEARAHLVGGFRANVQSEEPPDAWCLSSTVRNCWEYQGTSQVLC
jgi:hypothetical protein